MHGWETLDFSQRERVVLTIWQSGEGVPVITRDALKRGLSPAELYYTNAGPYPTELSCTVELWMHPDLPGLMYPARWTWERRYGATARANGNSHHPDRGWYINDVALWEELKTFAWAEITDTSYYTPPA